MITIILPISRTDYLKPVFDCLDKLERPGDTELLIITDGDDSLARAVDRRLDSINYKRIQVINFGDKPGEDIDSRRYRISAIHNKAKHFVGDDCEYVFLVEDDTVYTPDTLTKMLQAYEGSEYLGFIEGVELGRRKTPYIGAWAVEGDAKEPTVIASVLPEKEWLKRRTLSVIDAGGLYCCLADAPLYKQHTFEPYDKVGKNGLGCDVNFGLWLKSKGRVSCIDWSIQCDHIGEKGSVNMGNTKPVQVVFEKRSNKWESRAL